MSIAVFAGTFDPFTIGHLDIVERACVHFDKFYVSVCRNPSKTNHRFDIDARIAQINDAVKGFKNVQVAVFDGLLIEHCRKIGADCLIRGIRNGNDVEYERQLESVNKKLDPKIETMYLLAKPEHAYISSSLVRQLMDIGISINGLVPDADHIIFKKWGDKNGK